MDKTAKMWDATNGRELLTLKGHNNMVLGVAFLPDGRRIVTGGDDSTAKLWETASGTLQVIEQLYKGRPISI